MENSCEISCESEIELLWTMENGLCQSAERWAGRGADRQGLGGESLWRRQRSGFIPTLSDFSWDVLGCFSFYKFCFSGTSLGNFFCLKGEGTRVDL